MLKRSVQPAGSFDAQAAILSPGGKSRVVQRQARGGDGDTGVHAAAERGKAGGGGKLPHGDAIQQSFGRHDVSDVQSPSGGTAREATQSMGANAYATGNHVVLGAGGQDLHTVAHEAAHVVQQRGGVSLAGGVGRANDKYERQADAVADLVVQGKSAEPLLGGTVGATPKRAIQRQERGAAEPSATTGGPGRQDLLEPTKEMVRGSRHLFQFACERQIDALRDAAQAQQEIAGLVFEVAFAFLAPGLGSRISSSIGRISNAGAASAVRTALTGRHESIATALGEVAKVGLTRSVSPGQESQAFIGILFDNFVRGTTQLINRLDTASDAELVVAHAIHTQILEDGNAYYLTRIQDAVQRFQRDVVPIGRQSRTPEAPHAALPASSSTTGLVSVDFGDGRPVLVRIRTTNGERGGRVTSQSRNFETFIDQSMRDIAISRAQAVQPRGIQAMPRAHVQDRPAQAPGSAARY